MGRLGDNYLALLALEEDARRYEQLIVAMGAEARVARQQARASSKAKLGDGLVKPGEVIVSE